MPTIVIAGLLGIPPSDRDDFRRWSEATLAFDPAGTREMMAYFEGIIEEREREPGADDLISLLLDARVEGERLDPRELLGFCMLLLIAGNETTTNLLSNTLLNFRDFPEELERVKADADLLPGAVEESLRYRSPVQMTARVSTAETEIGGQVIPAGEVVWPFIGSANRDEARFDDPDRFDAARSPNRHLAFGRGIHFCLGAPLARLEATIALQHLLERLPNIRVAENARLERIPSRNVSGPVSLPILT